MWICFMKYAVFVALPVECDEGLIVLSGAGLNRVPWFQDVLGVNREVRNYLKGARWYWVGEARRCT